MRDSQRRKVYRWEASLPQHGVFATPEEIADFVEYAWLSAWREAGARAEIPRVVIEHPRRRPVLWDATRDVYGRLRPGNVLEWGMEEPQYASANRREWAIHLPSWAWRPDAVLHELAHLLDTRAPAERGAHDAAFVGILLSLRHRILGEDPEELRRSAMAGRVRVQMSLRA
jgi:hypothetical protein